MSNSTSVFLLSDITKKNKTEMVNKKRKTEMVNKKGKTEMVMGIKGHEFGS